MNILQTKYRVLLSAAFLTMVLMVMPAVSNEAFSATQPLKCETGPVDKIYGLTQWLVYSCNDKSTLLIVTAEGNPSMPFYYTFSLRKNKYQLKGEGTGNKKATDVAFKELQALSDQDITALIAETKSPEKSKH